MITVEEREQIRRLYYIEKKSIREIARVLGISRQSIRKAIDEAEAPTYQLQKPRPKRRLGEFTVRIEQMFMENKRLPRKQRYTAHRIFVILKGEGYTGSESNLRGYVAELKKSHTAPQSFLPLEFDPGQDAQVDWYEAEAIIAGLRQTVQVFTMRLSYSRRLFVRAYPGQKQEAFFEGHVLAFAHYEGVPHRLSYDNLSTAVRMLSRHVREESQAFITFRSHYLFKSHFCTPGQGHEKGGVEHGAGYSRRNFLVPIPRVASFAELNAYLLSECLSDDERTVSGQPRSIAAMWQEERMYLRPLPIRAFECCVTRAAKLTSYSQVIFDTNRYSVPVKEARTNLVVRGYPFEVQILREGGTDGPPQVIARHPRCYGTAQDVFDPLHYLTLLEQRPGAFEYAKPLKRWRLDWPASYHQLLSRLESKWPEGRGVKEFIQILKLHLSYPTPLVEQAILEALSFNCDHYDGVYHCLSRLLQPEQIPLPLLDLTDRPNLVGVGKQPVDLPQYDQLLKHKKTGG